MPMLKTMLALAAVSAILLLEFAGLRMAYACSKSEPPEWKTAEDEAQARYVDAYYERIETKRKRKGVRRLK